MAASSGAEQPTPNPASGEHESRERLGVETDAEINDGIDDGIDAEIDEGVTNFQTTELAPTSRRSIGDTIGGWTRRVRSFRLTSRERFLGLAAVGTALGIIATGTSPTGGLMSDAILLTPSVLFALWTARAAPRFAIALGAAVPLLLVPLGGSAWVGPVLGITAIGLTTAPRWASRIQRRFATDPSVASTLAVAALLVSLSSLGSVGVFGLTTLIGIGIATTVITLGLERMKPSEVRRAQRIVVATLGAAVVSIVVAGVFAWWARSDLDAARDELDAGMTAARSADISTAGSSVDDAHRRLSHAHLKLANPLTWPARLVPGVAQNLRAASVGADAAAEFTGAIDDTIDLAVGGDDAGGVAIRDGAIDLASIERLVAATGNLPGELERLTRAARSTDSPWLVPPLADGLETIATTADRQAPVLQRYADATELLPAFLGADGARHYFVMFTTPAEARGQGGFMGNFAEITIDGGKVSMSRFGRVNDLEAAMDDHLKLVDAPADWLARYGPYGFATEPDGVVAGDAWAIINLSAHFPSTAQVVAEMYPRSGGNTLDGVFSLDVYGLQALVGLVGPIEVDGGPTLNGENAAEFLLLDQYRLDPDDGADRVDMLSTIANEVVVRLLREDPPSPGSLASALAPLGPERRLLAWSPTSAEQALYADIGVSGAVLDPHYRSEGADDDDQDSARPGFQVVLNNGTGSKIDSFARRTITVAGTDVVVKLRNTAPSSGLPDYVIGTARDLNLPLGTSVTNFTVYSTDRLSRFTLDGERVDPPAGVEAGYHTYDMRFAIGPGEERTITFKTAQSGNVNLRQPLARGVDTDAAP